MLKVQVTYLNSFLNIEMGQSPEAEHVNQDGLGLPLLNGPAEFTDKYPVPVQYTTNAKRFASKADILFCVRGSTTGRMNIADQKYAIGRGLAAISHKKGRHLNSFVKGLIDCNLSNLLGGTLGSVFPNLTKDQLFEFRCSIPDLPTQQKIAAVLSALDDKIELNNKINADLEAMAKTLYDYWFVQFEFPDQSGRPYKSSGGAMVWNEQLKKEIPEGWEVKRLSSIADTGSGGTPKSTIKEFYEGGKIPWINSGELNNPFIIGTENFITELGLKNSNAKLFPKNSILVAMYGATAGKVSFLKIEATTNQAICALIPKKEETNFYIKFCIEDLYTYLVNLSSGSARDNLSQDKIKNLELILPKSELLAKFHLSVKPFFEKYYLNSLQNQTLSTLRDWLLPMLMNGQVSVGEAYEKVADVLSVAAEEGISFQNKSTL